MKMQASKPRGSDPPGAPWDLYREIHKAMRHALLGVTTLAGQTDADDAQALRRLVDEWRQVAFVLEGHHQHEARFCEPLIRRHAPALQREIEAAHHRSEATMAHLHRLAERLAHAEGAEAIALVRTFYLDLADFASFYLPHLRDEEDRAMPALNAAMSNDELAAVTAQIRGSVAPTDMCIFIRYMVPAMNDAERLALLEGFHAGAPAPVFEMFRKAAEMSLEPAQYAKLALGFETTS